MAYVTMTGLNRPGSFDYCRTASSGWLPGSCLVTAARVSSLADGALPMRRSGERVQELVLLSAQGGAKRASRNQLTETRADWGFRASCLTCSARWTINVLGAAIFSMWRQMMPKPRQSTIALISATR